MIFSTPSETNEISTKTLQKNLKIIHLNKVIFKHTDFQSLGLDL